MKMIQKLTSPSALAVVWFSLACSGTAPNGSDSSGGSGGRGDGPASGGLASSGGGTSDGAPAGGSAAGGNGGSGGQISMENETGGASSGGQGATGGSGDVVEVDWPLINGIQWADTEGNPIQAHGGGMLKVGEEYYWFGENRNPDGTFYAVSAYRSKDLRRWEHVHDVLTMDSDPDLKPANIERPKVVYNEATQKFVMWMHWENGMDYGAARSAVASSDQVAGDYDYHGSFRPLQDSGVMDHGRPGYMSRDCTLFVDDDGTGYFLSASNENYDLHLYRLTDDYLSIAERTALLFEGGHREAPALFKRNDTYFLITSGATGWSPNQAQYATSSSLASGWSNLKNVGDSTTFYSQSTYVLPVEGSSGAEYLYMGDRWAGAYGGRVNDSTYVWQPIEFPSATSMSMSFDNTLRLDANVGTVTGSVETFVLENKKSGLDLSFEGQADENGAALVLGAPDATSHFAVRLNYNADGHFRLTHASGGTVIDVPDESVTANTHLQLWEDNGGDHQAWRLIDTGEGSYLIENKKSGLFVGVAGGATTPGAGIEQQPKTGGSEQLWILRVEE